MDSTEEKGITERLIGGYNTMLKRLQEWGNETREGAGPALRHGIDAAMERASELGELSREEAERIGDYLRRDLHDAAAFINQSGQEFREWLHFDVSIVEQELAKRFASMVDQTQLELDKLEQMANKVGEWHTGEVVSIGTLECKGCGEHLRFHHTSRIPPCPKCRGTRYRRIANTAEG